MLPRSHQVIAEAVVSVSAAARYSMWKRYMCSAHLYSCLYAYLLHVMLLRFETDIILQRW